MSVEQDQLYARLMEINSATFATGSYEVAFYVLSAAFHRAKELSATPLLLKIEQRAREQLSWIDTYHDTHPLSSSSATSRGHRSMYGLLIKQSEIEKQKMQWKYTYRSGL